MNENRNDSSYVTYGLPPKTKRAIMADFLLAVGFLGFVLLFGTLVLIGISLCEFWLS